MHGRRRALDPLGATLRAELARTSMTQRDLAAKMGRTQSWVSRFINGKTPRRVDDLRVIAAVLGMPADRLLNQ